MRVTSLLLIAALAGPLPARAADDPAVWLAQLYAQYHRAEKQVDLLKVSAEEALVPRASRAFAAMLKRDIACEVKSHEICAIDWDFVVNGQAWELSQVKVGALQAAGQRATVTVKFVNLKSTNSNDYEFVREDGAWKLNDVVSGQSGRAPIRISKILRDFKLY